MFMKRDSVVNEQPKSIVDLFGKELFSRNPIFLLTPSRKRFARRDKVSFSELDRRARAVAATLQQRLAAEERVLLLLPPGLDYLAAFFGCLYAGVVAVPAYPARANSNLLRIESIVADADASLALTANSIVSHIKPLLTEHQALQRLNWLDVEEALGVEECIGGLPPLTEILSPFCSTHPVPPQVPKA